MNKRCFRLIFSKSLGFLIPVAETTKTQRKPGQQTTATSPPKPFNGSLKYLVLSVLLAGMPGLTAADILPDADKPSGTSVINAANGVPVIEIANPNDKGLSHNRFNQFDVPQPGVIFNNSRVNGLSQLGGMVLLNPNLQRTATAILTEVTGNRPSSINGTLEVFGDKADLLIAKAVWLTGTPSCPMPYRIQSATYYNRPPRQRDGLIHGQRRRRSPSKVWRLALSRIGREHYQAHPRCLAAVWGWIVLPRRGCGGPPNTCSRAQSQLAWAKNAQRIARHPRVCPQPARHSPRGNIG